MIFSDILRKVVVLYAIIQTCNGLRCYTCQDMPNPHYCLHVTNCTAGETCFTEEAVTASGDIVFHTGCMPTLQCSSIGRRSGDITACMACCNKDYCNNAGCGITAIPRDQRGPFCFSCDVTKANHQCNKVVTCGDNEICGLYNPQDYAAIPELVLQTSCMSKTQCRGLYLSTTNTRCVPTCCDADYCNDRCNATSPHLHITASPSSTAATTTTATNTQGTVHCPSDHKHDHATGLCIKIFSQNTKYSWTDALDKCAAIGDTLVTIDTRQKMIYIHNLLAGHHTNFYWIGGLDKFHNDTFYWPSGHRFTYSNWGGGSQSIPNKQPEHGDQDCVGLYYKDNYKWHDATCSVSWHGYICEHSLSPPVSVPLKCSETNGYVDLGHGLCVHIHDDHENTTWDQARDSCQHERAHLVVLDSRAKSAALRHYLDRYDRFVRFWIGALDTYQNDTFYWVTGQPVTYTDWYVDPKGTHTQPDLVTSKSEPEDCVGTYPYPNKGSPHHWHDAKCSTLLSYICQRL